MAIKKEQQLSHSGQVFAGSAGSTCHGTPLKLQAALIRCALGKSLRSEGFHFVSFVRLGVCNTRHSVRAIPFCSALWQLEYATQGSRLSQAAAAVAFFIQPASHPAGPAGVLEPVSRRDKHIARIPHSHSFDAFVREPSRRWEHHQPSTVGYLTSLFSENLPRTIDRRASQLITLPAISHHRQQKAEAADIRQ
ncbi:uncharacterized protein LOC117587546 [Drosophila guanche]|uniref:uncharacterized protein LOC117587546 n=1 Tax=Drosophila guanche TaxID=7266 RepID=UPI0014711F00|nr:uncharacterized protein LOC117587546 [Drosophila guanche]